jgi:hypothetical protein
MRALEAGQVRGKIVISVQLGAADPRATEAEGSTA